MVPFRFRNLRFGLKSMFVLILGMAIGYSLNEWSELSMRQTMRAWDLLGLDLSEEPQATFSQLNTRYRGGMHINAVRQNSPAAHEGILPGESLWACISGKPRPNKIFSVSSRTQSSLRTETLSSTSCGVRTRSTDTTKWRRRSDSKTLRMNL